MSNAIAAQFNPVGREAIIGRILLELGKLTPEQAERVLRVQKERGVRFGEAAQSLGLVSEADIQQALAHQFDYPYLSSKGKYPAELVAAYQPFTAQVEALRAVRSQIMLRWFATGRKALVIASVDSKGGGSFFAANLAVVFSQLGEKTLLIDANLRAPRQHEIFNIQTKLGLSDILARRAGLETIAKAEPFANLSVLAAGTLPPNPQELVNRDSFQELNENLGNLFDVILIDVPAFSTGADALTITAQAGGVLLVARKNETRLEDISIVGEQLVHTGAEIIGSVLVDF